MALATVLALTRQVGPAEQEQDPRGGRPRFSDFDSAGTHAYRRREPPDVRATAALVRRGYAVGKQRSRQVTVEDFDRFDLILAMDYANLEALRELCPPEHSRKLRLFLDFAPGFDGQEMPDPYYGSDQGFERVLDLCEVGAHGLIAALRRGTA